MADTQVLESGGAPSSPFVAEILDIGQTAIELASVLRLLAEHLTVNRIAPSDGKHQLEGISKTVDRFAEEVQLLHARYRDGGATGLAS